MQDIKINDVLKYTEPDHDLTTVAIVKAVHEDGLASVSVYAYEGCECISTTTEDDWRISIHYSDFVSVLNEKVIISLQNL